MLQIHQFYLLNIPTLFLKFLLVSHLALSSWSSIIFIRSCNHSKLPCYCNPKFWTPIFKLCLHCFIWNYLQSFLAEIFIFSLNIIEKCPHSLPKATNLSEILTWHCSVNSTLFSFLGLNLFTSKFCNSRLFTDNLSPLFATTRWWSASHSAPLKDCTSRINECQLISVNIW